MIVERFCVHCDCGDIYIHRCGGGVDGSILRLLYIFGQSGMIGRGILFDRWIFLLYVFYFIFFVVICWGFY